MLYNEALWFNHIIKKHVKTEDLVLNIGSSTKAFIEKEQPYIKQYIFDELCAKNCTIKNIDIKDAEGVDIVGDVTNLSFIEKLKNLNPSIIICSNLLEHIEDRDSFCHGIANTMNRNTLLIVSVPYSFPFHADPIDTMFRPTPRELSELFPSLKLIEGKIINCGWFLSFMYSKKSVFKRASILIQSILAYGLATITNNTEKREKLEWSFKKIAATCAIYSIK
jgi:hypothetical protein